MLGADLWPETDQEVRVTNNPDLWEMRTLPGLHRARAVRSARSGAVGAETVTK